VPGSIAPPKLRTAKCAWVDSTSKTQGFGVGDRLRKMFLSRSSCAWSRFAHPWSVNPSAVLKGSIVLSRRSTELSHMKERLKRKEIKR